MFSAALGTNPPHCTCARRAFGVFWCALPRSYSAHGWPPLVCGMQMMEVLCVEENGYVVIRSQQLPKASFVQFRPMSKVFYDFADPKALYVPGRLLVTPVGCVCVRALREPVLVGKYGGDVAGPPWCRCCVFLRLGSLEKLLRSYSCLTKGDTVRFKYMKKTFDMEVVELKPAVSGLPSSCCTAAKALAPDLHAPSLTRSLRVGASLVARTRAPSLKRT